MKGPGESQEIQYPSTLLHGMSARLARSELISGYLDVEKDQSRRTGQRHGAAETNMIW